LIQEAEIINFRDYHSSSMTEQLSKDQILIRKLTEIILANLENEHFGVKELASESGVSQHRLNRRLRSISNKTISQFITEVRLRRALDMLKNEELTAAEVSYRVGFNSPAYFTKCFHDFFGYSPGRFKSGINSTEDKTQNRQLISEIEQKRFPLKIISYIVAGSLFLSGIIYILLNGSPENSDTTIAGSNRKSKEMSIAILPFKNLSNNPEDRYIYDGVMDEILTNLSLIHGLRVVSRTSVEQFRESKISTREIAKKLNVDYLVKASGQRYGNSIRLRVQLIEASTDRHIWAKSYEEKISEITGIFKIQSQVAQAIAAELNTTITPEEKRLINRIPTANLTAYDFYLRGNDELNIYRSLLVYRSDLINKQALKKAEMMFNKAIEYDSSFGRAYIGLADVFWAKHWSETYLSKNFLDSVLILANRALSFDDHLAAGYYYRGEYFIQKGKLEQALSEYEMSIRYNPNYWEVYYAIGQNVYLYNYDHMDFVKGLSYLHKAVSINHGKELPFLLRELGDAYSLWAGFPEKRKYYFMEAFKLDNDTISLENFSTEIERLETLKKRFSRDSDHIFTIFNLARTYASLGQYKEALKYAKKYENRLNERSYLFYSGRTYLGYIYWNNGFKDEAEKWFKEQEKISVESLRLNRNYSMDAYCDLASIYAFTNEKSKAYESLRKFSDNRVFPSYRVQWIKEDPMLLNIRNEPEFQKIVIDLEVKYESEHERVRKWLEEQGQF
jgi:TolB-like protein/AraC-like DNA-binding protein